MDAIGYLVDGVDCHAVGRLIVGGNEEDSVIGVEGFPVEEGGDGSHCHYSLSVFSVWYFSLWFPYVVRVGVGWWVDFLSTHHI